MIDLPWIAVGNQCDLELKMATTTDFAGFSKRACESHALKNRRNCVFRAFTRPRLDVSTELELHA